MLENKYSIEVPAGYKLKTTCHCNCGNDEWVFELISYEEDGQKFFTWLCSSCKSPQKAVRAFEEC